MFNQDAQLTTPEEAGVFNYEISSLSASFESPSAVCQNWLDTHSTG